jgi:galactonate dehydratase
MVAVRFRFVAFGQVALRNAKEAARVLAILVHGALEPTKCCYRFVQNLKDTTQAIGHIVYVAERVMIAPDGAGSFQQFGTHKAGPGIRLPEYRRRNLEQRGWIPVTQLKQIEHHRWLKGPYRLRNCVRFDQLPNLAWPHTANLPFEGFAGSRQLFAVSALHEGANDKVACMLRGIAIGLMSSRRRGRDTALCVSVLRAIGRYPVAAPVYSTTWSFYMPRIVRADVVPVPVSDKTVWQHLILSADDGRSGIGEYTLNDTTGELDAMALAAGRELVGRDIDPDTLVPVVDGLKINLPGWTVLSALDQAVCDLRAQIAGVPLATLLNPAATATKVPLYANINRRTVDRSPEGFAISAGLALDAGYQAMKMAPFDGVTPQTCQSLDGAALVDAGLDRVRAVASTLAGGADLKVDCHWRFTRRRADRLLDELAEIGVVWFECPIAETPEAIPDLVALRRACSAKGMRLAGCELMTGLEAFRPYIEGEAYDVIMPDVKHVGGMAEMFAVAAAATAQGTAISIHNPSGPVAHQVSVQVSAALGTGERLEVQFDESPLFMSVTEPPPRMIGGAAVLTDGPGLGVRLAAIAQASGHAGSPGDWAKP